MEANSIFFVKLSVRIFTGIMFRNRRSIAAFQLSYWEISAVKRIAVTLALAAAAVATAACGQTIEQKAATGAVAGALVAGPVGAAVGGAAGAAVGKAQKPN